jgi:hypothetical protein
MKKKTKTKKLKKAAPGKKALKKAARKVVKPPAKKPARKLASRQVKPAAKTKVMHAPRKAKANEVISDRSLGSSLTNNITRASREGSPAYRAGQSGDLQGISNVRDADSESVEELLEDGQALEAEIVQGVEGAPDEKPVPSRGRIEDDSIPDYDDRNKI